MHGHWQLASNVYCLLFEPENDRDNVHSRMYLLGEKMSRARLRTTGHKTASRIIVIDILQDLTGNSECQLCRTCEMHVVTYKIVTSSIEEWIRVNFFNLGGRRI